MQVRNLVLATDFSDTALHAAAYARKFATAFAAKVSAVYADLFLPPLYFTGIQTEALTGTLHDWKEGARIQLQSYIHTHLPGLNAEAIVMEKLPAEGILAAAENVNADLIVLGTHGRRGLNRMMMGSVAETVLRESSRPVLTVGPNPKRDPGTLPEIQQILCPINYTSIARESLELAATLSLKFDAQLTAIHVVESHAQKNQQEDELKQLCDWIPGEMRSRCNLRELTDRGNAAEQVIQMANSIGCDLIVIGAQHKRFSDTTVIGTTTVRILRHAPCPVLTLIRKG